MKLGPETVRQLRSLSSLQKVLSERVDEQATHCVLIGLHAACQNLAHH